LAALLSACGSSSTSQSVIAVSTPQLKTIAIDPPDPTLALGLTTQFTATGIYTDGSQQDLSQSVTWSSSNAAVASVSNGANANGLTTAVSQGTTTITATLGLVSGKATLTVTAAALELIAVTPTQPSLGIGGTQQFTATGIYSDQSTRDLTTTVTWVSGNVNIASISNAAATATVPGTYGLATGVSVGTTTITAALSNLSGYTTVTVTATSLVSIAVTPVNASIAKGATQQFTATGTYANGTTQNLTAAVTWTSGTLTVATISSTTGLATAVNVGSTLITATLGTASGSTNLTVAAATATLVSITVTPATATLSAPTNQTPPSTLAFIATGTYSDGTTHIVTSTATWASSNTAVATINNAGLATAVSVGTTLITAAQGGITSNAATLTVTAATQYAYAVNYVGAGSVLQFSIAPATGAIPGVLTALAPPTEAAGAYPFSLAVDPVGDYLYVANFSYQTPQGSVSQYSIGPDGVLTLIGTIATGSEPNGITVDPSGRYVYVANANDGTVSQYSITTGLLTAIPGALPMTGNQPALVVVHPTEPYAYVANYGNGTAPGTVSEYTILDNGALDSFGTVPTGAGPTDVAIAGQFAYVVNHGDGTVSLYSITNGVLAPAGIAANGLNGPDNIVFDKAGHAYVTNQGGNTVVEYSVSPTTGALTLIGNVAALSAIGITFDATYQYLYVTDRTTGTLSEFSIQPDGMLAPVGAGTVPLPAGTIPTGIVTAY
jgi:6-phosphogluconolactonase (cycloisomerase 2 family)